MSRANSQPIAWQGTVSPRGPVEVVIADDHAMVADGLSRLVSVMPGFHVSSVCTRIEEVEEAFSSRTPDLLLLDVDMPGLSIFSFIRKVSRGHPRTAILVVSGMPAEIYALRSITAGALGFVGKDEAASTLMTAVRTEAQGQISLPQGQTRSVLSAMAGRRSAGGLSALSARELEVFRLLGKGLPTRDVGRVMHISHRTVASHRLRIYHKLGISSTSELIRLATDHQRSEDDDA